MVVLFFFKQKTAYEMRISDWSSDGCSSDRRADGGDRRDAERQAKQEDTEALESAAQLAPRNADGGRRRHGAERGGSSFDGLRTRLRRPAGSSSSCGSEARRDGKACVSTCSSRW